MPRQPIDPDATRQPIPFRKVVERLLAAPPAPRAAKSKPKANKRAPKPR